MGGKDLKDFCPVITRINFPGKKEDIRCVHEHLILNVITLHTTRNPNNFLISIITSCAVTSNHKSGKLRWHTCIGASKMADNLLTTFWIAFSWNFVLCFYLLTLTSKGVLSISELLLRAWPGRGQDYASPRKMLKIFTHWPPWYLNVFLKM